MQIDNPLLMALLLIGLPMLALNVAAFWWQRWRQDALELAADPGTRHGLSETRLRVAPAPRAVVAALAGALAITLFGLQGQISALVWPGTLLLAVLIWNTVSLWLWELRFDSVGLSAPSQILWRRSYLWRQLVRVSDDNPLTWHFHFADGALLRVPKYLAGGQELLRLARHWLDMESREAATGSRQGRA